MPSAFTPSADARKTMHTAQRLSLATTQDIVALHSLAAAGDSVEFNARMSALAREVEEAAKLAQSTDLSAEDRISTSSAGRQAAMVRDGRHAKAIEPTAVIPLTPSFVVTHETIHAALSYPINPTGMVIELHLSAYHTVVDDEAKVGGTRNDFARVWGARLDNVGGSTSSVRGHTSRRYVSMPLTTEGVALAEELLAADPTPPKHSVPAILRGATTLYRYNSHNTFTGDMKKEWTVIVDLRADRTLAPVFEALSREIKRRIAEGVVPAEADIPAIEREFAERKAETEAKRIAEAKAAVVAQHAQEMFALLKVYAHGHKNAAEIVKKIEDAQWEVK